MELRYSVRYSIGCDVCCIGIGIGIGCARIDDGCSCSCSFRDGDGGDGDDDDDSSSSFVVFVFILVLEVALDLILLLVLIFDNKPAASICPTITTLPCGYKNLVWAKIIGNHTAIASNKNA